MNAGLAAAALLIIGGVTVIVMSKSDDPHVTVPSALSQPARPPISKPVETVYSESELENDKQLVDQFLPTHGEPIDVSTLPSGVNLVIHLRPAQLWSEQYNFQVLRASLTDDVSGWVANQIQKISRRVPNEIEEVTFGIILGPSGAEPQVSARIRLREAASAFDLNKEFGERFLTDQSNRPDTRIKIDGRFGYLVLDSQTVTIWPARMARELANWTTASGSDVSANLAELLRHTDRQRLFTIVGELPDLRRHIDELVPEASRQFLTAAINWPGDDVESVCWSIHPEPYLHAQLWLRPVSTTSPGTLRRVLDEKLTQLPIHVWKDVALKMPPREQRFRQFIGRLPAMLEAVRQSSVFQMDRRLLSVTTVLPAKAAPNLMLATLFTVNEAARTDLTSKSVPLVSPTAKYLPETVAERMKLPVDAEFNRTPLEQCLQFLCSEIEVNLAIDGNALKDAGYTRNMPQTFSLGRVPVQRVFYEVFRKYQTSDKEMAISVEEATRTITVSTRKHLQAHGLTEFPLRDQ